MLESKIEKKLIKKVKQHGGLVMKFISPGFAGIADRIAIFSEARIYFIELKAPGKELRPLQLKRKEQFEKLGVQVHVVDSYKAIEVFIKEVLP